MVAADVLAGAAQRLPHPPLPVSFVVVAVHLADDRHEALIGISRADRWPVAR